MYSSNCEKDWRKWATKQIKLADFYDLSEIEDDCWINGRWVESIPAKRLMNFVKHNGHDNEVVEMVEQELDLRCRGKFNE